MAYDLKPIKAPTAAGKKLKVLTSLIENPVTGPLLKGKLLDQAGVTTLRRVPTDDAPFRHLELHHPKWLNKETGPVQGKLDFPDKGFRFSGTKDFVEAYKAGRLTPTDVAHRFIQLADQSDKDKMGLFIARDREDLLKQAKASTERYQKGQPKGPLDGVPIAVKDEIDQAPYPTTVGTKFLTDQRVTRDAFAVAKLREAGALLVGKTNMHEIGIGVTGINPHYGPARNPYDPSRVTGGSSSGSAAVVASGLCPVAIGADGGGSIRIPAAFCGVVGLKPTFGRVSEQGAAPLCWSLAHIGPIAARVEDAALVYRVIGVPDHTEVGIKPPDPTINRLFDSDLKGLRIGIYTPWFEDADPQVVNAAYEVVSLLKDEGALVKEIEIPDLSVLRGVHLVTIVTEMVTAHNQYYAAHRKDYGLDTRLSLALGRALSSYDYVHAQRLRTRITSVFLDVLSRVDVILTPTVGITAPPIPEEAVSTGESNLSLTTEIMKYAPAANLTGLPAITFPAGYDDQGMPIGVQAMAGPWQEDLLLRIALSGQRGIERKKPLEFFDLLGL